MIRFSKALLIAAGSIATTGVALAQDDAPEDEVGPREGEPTPPPDETTEPEPARVPSAPPLTLYKGKILIAGSTVNINLSTDAAGEPISLAPSVWYGVDDKLTLGLTHDFGSTPWTPRPAFRLGTITVGTVTTPVAFGAGICLTGEEGGCNRPYDNVSADALYSIKNERLSLAAHPGLDIGSFDPFALALRLGVLGRYLVTDELSIVFDPRLRFGITERDSGNKEFIDLPIWVWYAINDKVSAYLHTGLNSAFEEFGDSVSIPLQIGGNYMVSPKLTAGLDFGFTKLNDGADGRVLGLRIMYAL